ncbi:MAG: protein-disulfide reductase DsbD [Burkholderiales bacterium]|nr:protein-disulfide reductase DsbD [Burkholderiales bacterium]
MKVSTRDKGSSVKWWRWWTAVLLGWGGVLLWTGQARAAGEFLPVAQAFKLEARVSPQSGVMLDFALAPKTHLYRDRFSVQALPESVKLMAPVLPTGVLKFDEGFGKKVEVYYDRLSVEVGVDAATAPGTPAFVKVGYQGCADDGICYPPQTRYFRLTLAQGGRVVAVAPATAQDAGLSQAGTPASASPAGAASPPIDASAATRMAERIQQTLASGNWLSIVGVFFVAGVLLSFTPCVLPMVPILSSIIVGEDGAVSRVRGLTLALSYSQGMALVYTVLGVAAGLLGEGLAAGLQSPWVLGSFGVLLVVLALSMFGAFHLQMPHFIQSHLTHHSGRLGGGGLLKVFIMGVLSALIVGPCVSGPLAGALVYLSQTRDVLLGGTALYALAWGMSVPLLLVGVSAGSLLPRAGLWMESVKTFFGLLLLGVAWWLVSPILAPLALLGLLGLLLALAAAFTGGFDHMAPQASLKHRSFKAVGMVLAILSVMELAGAVAGAKDPWDPLRPFIASTAGANSAFAASTRPVAFKRVASVAELDAALAEASKAGQVAMLDFYADWCVSCKEMERYTFFDPRVQDQLKHVVTLQADVTANSEADKALLKRFTLFGPPGIIFFDRQGREQGGTRVIGYQAADEFLKSLQAAGI